MSDMQENMEMRDQEWAWQIFLTCSSSLRHMVEPNCFLQSVWQTKIQRQKLTSRDSLIIFCFAAVYMFSPVQHLRNKSQTTNAAQLTSRLWLMLPYRSLTNCSDCDCKARRTFYLNPQYSVKGLEMNQAQWQWSHGILLSCRSLPFVFKWIFFDREQKLADNKKIYYSHPFKEFFILIFCHDVYFSVMIWHTCAL